MAVSNGSVGDRIAILLPDLRGGGAEKVALNLANAFVKRGLAVDMVVMAKTGVLVSSLDPRVRVVDLEAVRMRGLLRPLMRYLRAERPDALLACMWPLTVIAVLARKLTRVSTRIVVAEHISWIIAQKRYPLLHRFMLRTSVCFLFPAAHAVVAVSQGVADDLAAVSGLRRSSITVIYNPIVGAAIEAVMDDPPAAKAPAWDSAEIRILNVGTLKEQKKQALLLRAFCILRKQMNAHLLILGEGELRSELEALVDDLGLRDSVSMPGFVRNTGPYYRRADLFVLSSAWEGLPTVLIEALEAGTPIVSTDCRSGPREILCDGKYGRLVPVGDAEALATVMLASLRDRPDSEALKARARDFSVEKIATQYLNSMIPKRGDDAS